jgi:hypothetical protein
MKLYDDVVKSKVNNYMVSPKHQPSAKAYMRSNLTVISRITDKEGLHKAYAATDKLFASGETLYIAGTSSLRDVWDDLKIPFHLTSKSDRYQHASKFLEENKGIKQLVGHSLGGSVALELQDNMADRNFKTNTYGAPVFSFTSAENRYRNIGDPVSMLDFGSKSSLHVGLNPHTYDNFDKNVVSDKY